MSMNTIYTYWPLVFGIALGVICIWLGLRQLHNKRFRALSIMTPNEQEFFKRLCRALPEHYVFPQVALNALVTPVASFKRNRNAYFAVNAKRVDYAVFTKRFELICLIELDDQMHNRANDSRRDAITRSAGIVTLRWESKHKPDERKIRDAVRAHE
jgi:hypothetical protein